jgi:hypothetical protein
VQRRVDVVVCLIVIFVDVVSKRARLIADAVHRIRRRASRILAPLSTSVAVGAFTSHARLIENAVPSDSTTNALSLLTLAPSLSTPFRVHEDPVLLGDVT